MPLPLAAVPEQVTVFFREWVWWTLLNGFSVPLALPTVLVFLILVLFFRLGIGLGLPRLFWQPERGPQFMVGIGIGAVIWQVFFAGYVFEEFATNFTVDRPPFCEIRPPYDSGQGIAHPDFPGRFRTDPASVWSVWWYAGVVAGAAAAMGVAVAIGVWLIQVFARLFRWQFSGWRPYERKEPDPPIGYGIWLPLGAVAGWMIMTGLTFVVFNLPRDVVAEPIGEGLLRTAKWGAAAERRQKVEAVVQERLKTRPVEPGAEVRPGPMGSPASPAPKPATRAWFEPYYPAFAAFVLSFALIFVVSVVIILLPQQFRLYSPAVGIVLLLNLAVFLTILLSVFPPLAVSGNFLLIALAALAVLAGRSYKFRFPNLPVRKPVSLTERYQKLIEAEAGVTDEESAEAACGELCEVPGGGGVRLLQSRSIPYPHPAAWSGPKPPLAIVSLSGGGSRAAAWAMRVLTTLETRFQSPGRDRPPVAFPYHVRLVTGASGGMIAGAYYVTSLGEPGPGGTITRNPIPRFDGKPTPLTHADLLDGVRQDLLTPVTHTLVNHDLLALFAPFRFRYDRGQALEAAMKSALRGQLHVPLASLRDGEAAGWRPSLIFSPMLVEDGRQLFISNLDLREETQNRAFILGEDDRRSPSDPEGYGLLSREGVEFFKLFPGATEFSVATAARMSASFPYLLPAVPLPTNPPRRVVDAGYYDNFGIGIAASWVFNHVDWIEANTSGVVVIQVRDGVSEAGRKREEVTDSFPSLVDRGLQWLTTPPAGLWNSRQTANAFRNDNLLHLLEDFFLARGLPRGFFATVAFELSAGDDVALNFSLTDAEVRAIEMAAAGETFGIRVESLLNWWHGRLAAPKGAMTLAQVDAPRGGGGATG